MSFQLPIRLTHLTVPSEEEKRFFKEADSEQLVSSICKKSPPLLLEELMLHIFSFLNEQSLIRCALVSKKWKQLSSERVLWKELCPLTDMEKKFVDLNVICPRTRNFIFSPPKLPSITNVNFAKHLTDLEVAIVEQSKISPQTGHINLLLLEPDPRIQLSGGYMKYLRGRLLPELSSFDNWIYPSF